MQSSFSRVLTVYIVSHCCSVLVSTYHIILWYSHSTAIIMEEERSVLAAAATAAVHRSSRSDVVDAPHFRLDDNDIENMDNSGEDNSGDGILATRHVPPVSWTNMKKRTIGVMMKKKKIWKSRFPQRSYVK